MSKTRVFIVHRWDSSPSEDWYPWMKERLESDGHTVRVLKMPNPKKPTIRDWVATLQQAVKKPDDHTFLVGHSIGCQTIMRYLETFSKGETVGGALFVAPWFTLKGLETNEDRDIARPWIETPIDTDDVVAHVRSIFALFSNNDPYVPIANAAEFERRLNAWTRTERKAGHFMTEDVFDQLPQGLAALREMIESAQT